MEIKKIIISRTDKIGDLILSIPSFFMLRKMFPDAEIIVLVRKYNYDIVKNLQYIDRVIKIDDYTQKNLVEKISYFKADVFIALYSDTFICKLARKSKAKIRVGPYSKLVSFFTYNKGVYQKRSKSIKNEAEYNLDLVRSLNPVLYDENYEINTEIIIDKNNEEIGEKFYNSEISKNSKVVVINPFTGGSAKNITDEQYHSLIKNLISQKKDIEVIITAHISEDERAHKIADGIERTHVFSNGGPLLNIAAIIKRADVYVGGSTGPTHMAGALQKKIVAVYPNLKTQHPIRWGVFGNSKVEYLIPDYDNPKENYSHKYFDTYNDVMEELLAARIIRSLER